MNTNGEAGTPLPDYYLWEVPGKAISIYLHFDVIDRLMPEVMRGFGAIPRRGAEVGGILLGTVETNERTIVRIDDFAPIRCEHKRGPSYLLSDADLDEFDGTLQRWRNQAEQPTRPVGFYRSHTREGFGLTDEDLEFLDARFPEPSDIVLLVKPFATRASVGGFFFREGTTMQTDATYLEFPFRRQDLGGGETPRRGPAETPRPTTISDAPLFGGALGLEREREPAGEPEPKVSGVPAPPQVLPQTKRGNVWIPLSFIFLLLGVLLGFQSALTVHTQGQAGMRDPYSIGLTISRSGDNLHIRWDRLAPAIRSAQRGTLAINDGVLSKAVDLDSAQLQNGSVIYRHVSDSIQLRLELIEKDHNTVTESLDVNVDQIPGEKPPLPMGH